MSLGHQLDWVAKYQLMTAYMDRHGCDWRDDRLAALDLQYHDLRPERSLYARLGLERLVTDARRRARGDRCHRPTPGPGSGASASPGGPKRSSPPTGTPSSSTSEPTPSAASL